MESQKQQQLEPQDERTNLSSIRLQHERDMEKSAALMREMGAGAAAASSANCGDLSSSSIASSTFPAMASASETGTACIAATALEALDRSVDMYFTYAQKRKGGHNRPHHHNHRSKRQKYEAESTNSKTNTPDGSSDISTSSDEGSEEGHNPLHMKRTTGTRAPVEDKKLPAKNRRNNEQHHAHRGGRNYNNNNVEYHRVGPSANSDSSAHCSHSSSDSSDDSNLALSSQDSALDLGPPQILEWAGLLKKCPRNTGDRDQIKEWLKEVLVVSNVQRSAPLKVVTSSSSGSSSANFNSSSSSSSNCWESGTNSSGGDIQSNSSTSGEDRTASNEEDVPNNKLK